MDGDPQVENHSSRASKFNTKHLCGRTQPSVTPGPGDPTPSLGFQKEQVCMCHIGTHATNIYTYKIFLNNQRHLWFKISKGIGSGNFIHVDTVDGSGHIILGWLFFIGQFTSYLSFLLKLHTLWCKESDIALECSPMCNLRVSHVNLSHVHHIFTCLECY